MFQDIRLKTYLNKLDNLFIAYPYNFKVQTYLSDILAVGKTLGGRIIDEGRIIFSSEDDALLFNLFMAHLYLGDPLDSILTIIDAKKSLK